ncbi:MAG: FmdB family zinc ribbon protein [Thermoanaerobaculia bacterium]
MPLYEYQCQECAETHEIVQRFSDEPQTICPSCGGVLKKLISSPAIRFKGSGFYLTDYGKGTAGPASRVTGGNGGSDASSANDSSSAPSESTKSDSAKPDSSKADSAKSDAPKSSPAAQSPSATRDSGS